MSSPCGCDAPYIGPGVEGCGSGSLILFMSLLNQYVTDTCDVSEICSRITPTTEPLEEYDFVVIGSGSGGSVVAGRLAEVSQWKTLLIEAGGDEPPGIQVPSLAGQYLSGPNDINWFKTGFKTEPQPEACGGVGCTWNRGKVLGGTSVINGMMFVRGTPADFDRWESLGAEGWGYEDVLPYFLRSENNLQIGSLVNESYHGTEGPVTVSRYPYQPELAWDILAAAKEQGFPVSDDLNGEQFSGFAVTQMNNINTSRLSSARAYVRPQRNKSNLHVMLNSTATRILTSKNGSQVNATGVEFIFNNKTYTVRVTKEVIVSAGTVQSPQLLLLSGIGPKAALDRVNITQVHELPGVGQNLHNHVTYSGLRWSLTKAPIENNDLNWTSVIDYLYYRKGPLSSTGMSGVTSRISSKYADPSGNDPDLQLFFYGWLQGSCATSCNDSPPSNAFRQLTINPVNLHPRSRGNITLRTNNPLDPPLIWANYLVDPQDVLILVEGIRVVQRLANGTSFKEKYGAQPNFTSFGNCDTQFEYDSDDFWICAIRAFTGPENHQVGTCKIGNATDPLAVVNSQLEVHGIPNLRVIDASVMPQVVSGNTHATTVMIGERGAHHIKEKYNISDPLKIRSL